jgi:uncharacterized protein YjaG (DUF416 family)
MLERASQANSDQTLVANQASDQGWALDWAIFRKCYDLFL